MACEKAPAFQFYPKDFLTDVNVASMTLHELGAYTKLLCLCWLEGSLPAEVDALARLCRVSPTCFGRLWPALAPCFTVVNGRLIQGRLERERQKQEAYRALKVEAGRKGGRPKAEGKQRLSRGEAKQSPPSSSSSSSPISDLQEVPDRAKEPRYPPAFQGFWATYPRKVGKVAALKAWRSLNPHKTPSTKWERPSHGRFINPSGRKTVARSSRTRRRGSGVRGGWTNRYRNPGPNFDRIRANVGEVA